MVVRGASGVDGTSLEQRADLVQRRRVIAVVLAVDRRVAAAGGVEAEDQADRRGLPGPVRTEKPGHDTGTDSEGEIVDGPLVTVVLRQVSGLDHGASTVSRRGRWFRPLTQAQHSLPVGSCARCT